MLLEYVAASICFIAGAHQILTASLVEINPNLQSAIVFRCLPTVLGTLQVLVGYSIFPGV